MPFKKVLEEDQQFVFGQIIIHEWCSPPSIKNRLEKPKRMKIKFMLAHNNPHKK